MFFQKRSCGICRGPLAIRPTGTFESDADGVLLAASGLPELACSRCGAIEESAAPSVFFTRAHQGVQAAAEEAARAAGRESRELGERWRETSFCLSLEPMAEPTVVEADPWDVVISEGLAQVLDVGDLNVSDLIFESVAVDGLTDFVYRVQHRDALRAHAGSSLRHCFDRQAVNLHGPTGTGKSLAAKAIGHELGLPVLRANLGNISSKFVGETEKALQRLFDAARARPCVLFIDEADSLFASRTAGQSGAEQAMNQIKNAMLVLLNDFSGVIVTATNLRASFDPALARRMRDIEVPAPSPATRRKLWTRFLTGRPFAPDVKLPDLIDALERLVEDWQEDPDAQDRPFVGAHMEETVCRALVRAHRRQGGPDDLSHADLLAALETLLDEFRAASPSGSPESAEAVENRVLREVVRHQREILSFVSQLARDGSEKLQNAAGKSARDMQATMVGTEILRGIEAQLNRQAVAIDGSGVIDDPSLDAYTRFSEAVERASRLH